MLISPGGFDSQQVLKTVVSCSRKEINPPLSATLTKSNFVPSKPLCSSSHCFESLLLVQGKDWQGDLNEKDLVIKTVCFTVNGLGRSS